MSNDIRNKSIYEKMYYMMKNIQYLQKDDAVEYGNTKYKALSEEKVTMTIRPLLTECGLVVYPVTQTSRKEGNITTVDVTYKMVNVDNPEESITLVSSGQGADTQDKGVGKAMTYAFKYMWLRSLAIPTGEDADKISSEELTDMFKAEKEKGREKDRPELINRIGEIIDEMNLSTEKVYAKIGIANLSELDTARMPGCIKWLKGLTEDNRKGLMR